MRIEVLGYDTMSAQARTYAEYRLFAELSRTRTGFVTLVWFFGAGKMIEPKKACRARSRWISRAVARCEFRPRPLIPTRRSTARSNDSAKRVARRGRTFHTDCDLSR